MKHFKNIILDYEDLYFLGTINDLNKTITCSLNKKGVDFVKQKNPFLKVFLENWTIQDYQDLVNLYSKALGHIDLTQYWFKSLLKNNKFTEKEIEKIEEVLEQNVILEKYDRDLFSKEHLKYLDEIKSYWIDESIVAFNGMKLEWLSLIANRMKFHKYSTKRWKALIYILSKNFDNFSTSYFRINQITNTFIANVIDTALLAEKYRKRDIFAHYLKLGFDSISIKEILNWVMKGCERNDLYNHIKDKNMKLWQIIELVDWIQRKLDISIYNDIQLSENQMNDIKWELINLKGHSSWMLYIPNGIKFIDKISEFDKKLWMLKIKIKIFFMKKFKYKIK